MTETKAVATQGQITGLAIPDDAPAKLKERIIEVRDNLTSVEDFRLPRIKMTADGAEVVEGEEPVEKMEFVILHTRKTNVYYEDAYNPKDIQPPTCSSQDGITPDASIKEPVHKTCAGCPMAEFGTNAMKSGKACRNLMPLSLLMSDEAIMPRQLTITPASLKAIRRYLIDLTERGINYRKVKTKIEFFKADSSDKYVQAKFIRGEKLSEERQAEVECLRKVWLPTILNQALDERDAEAEVQSAPSKGEPDTKGQF